MITGNVDFAAFARCAPSCAEPCQTEALGSAQTTDPLFWPLVPEEIFRVFEREGTHRIGVHVGQFQIHCHWLRGRVMCASELETYPGARREISIARGVQEHSRAHRSKPGLV